MKLIKYATVVAALTLSPVALAEKTTPKQPVDYRQQYMAMCTSRADLAETITRLRYAGMTLSAMVSGMTNPSHQQLAFYVYSYPHMVSDAGRKDQGIRIHNSVFSECVKTM